MKNAFNKQTYSLQSIQNYFINNTIPPVDEYKNLAVLKRNEYKIIKLNRPNKMNSWNLELAKELWDFTINSKNDYVIFLGNGKSFSTGADLNFFLEQHKDKTQHSNEFFYYSYGIFYNFHTHFRDNTIFIWNGAAMGGGLSIGAYSKFRIATESTVIAMPEAKFQYFSNCIFSDFVSRYISQTEALHFSIFSEFYSSYEVYLTSFASHFVLNKYIPNIIEEVLQVKDPLSSISLINSVIDRYHDLSVQEFNDKQSYEDKVNKRRDMLKKIYDFPIERKDFESFYAHLSKSLELNSPELYKVFKSKSLFSIKVNYDITMAAFDSNLTYEDRFNLDTHYINAYNETNWMYEGITEMFKNKQSKPKF